MKVLYAVAAGAILVLGVFHMAMTFTFASSPLSKVWFFGTGMAIALGGVLNLLNRQYGRAAPGLRAVCIGTNLLMIGFAGIAGRVSGGSITALIVVVTVAAFVLVLSAMPAASLRR